MPYPSETKESCAQTRDEEQHWGMERTIEAAEQHCHRTKQIRTEQKLIQTSYRYLRTTKGPGTGTVLGTAPCPARAGGRRCGGKNPACFWGKTWQTYVSPARKSGQFRSVFLLLRISVSLGTGQAPHAAPGRRRAVRRRALHSAGPAGRGRHALHEPRSADAPRKAADPCCAFSTRHTSPHPVLHQTGFASGAATELGCNLGGQMGETAGYLTFYHIFLLLKKKMGELDDFYHLLDSK